MKEVTQDLKISRQYYFAVFFALFYAAFGGFLSYLKGYHYYNFEFLCSCAFYFLFSMLILFSFIYKQKLLSPFDEVYGRFFRLFVAGCFANISLLSLVYLPNDEIPYLFVPVVVSIVLNPYLSTMLCAISVLSYAVVYGLSLYHLLCFLVLVFVGALSGDGLRKRKGSGWTMLTIVSCNIIVWTVIYIIEHNSFSLTAFYSIAINTAITFALIYVASRMLQLTLLRPEELVLEKALAGNYPLNRALSAADDKIMLQSRYCAKMSKDLAKVLEYSTLQIEVAALYYRVEEINLFSKDTKKPLWLKCRLPVEVKEILYEAKGLRRKPESKESALVYICNSVIMDLDLLGPDPNKTKREIEIHRIMNNISSSGILDESGMSMNQFLMIKKLITQYLERGL